MNEVLVTGAGGFVGSHLLEELGDEAVGFDFRKDPLQDVTNLSSVETFWAKYKPDIVVHLAANPRLDVSKKYPWWDAKENVLGTINTLHTSLKENVKLYIYASTCQVYDVNTSRPIHESFPCNPRSAYAISKYSGEMYCRYFERQGLNVCIFRFFNIYGPRQSRGYVIPDLLKRTFLEQSSEVKVLGPPDDSRDYVYVKDVVRAITEAIKNRNVVNKTINVGSGIETTTKQLCEGISKVLHKKVEFCYGERPPGRLPSRFQSNISRANMLLKWKPVVELEEGLKLTATSKGFIHACVGLETAPIQPLHRMRSHLHKPSTQQ